MRKSQEFRPTVDPLEGRQVLSAVVLTGLTLKHVIRAIDQDFANFNTSYKVAIHHVRVDASGNPNPDDVTRFFNFVDKRSGLLSRQLTAQTTRIPFGPSGLAPTLQGEVANMDTALTSVTTVSDALNAGPTITQARLNVLSDLNTFLVAQQQAGNVRIVGH